MVATSSARTRLARCSKAPGLISRSGRPRSTACPKARNPGSRGGARVERDHVLERRALRADGQDLAELLQRRDEDRPRARVLELRSDLLRGERRVDRDGPSAGAEDGVVGHRPLRPVLRQDRDPVARLHAERVQPQGEGADRVAEVRGRDGLPLARRPWRRSRSCFCKAAAFRKMSQRVRTSSLIVPSGARSHSVPRSTPGQDGGPPLSRSRAKEARVPDAPRPGKAREGSSDAARDRA